MARKLPFIFNVLRGAGTLVKVDFAAFFPPCCCALAFRRLAPPQAAAAQGWGVIALAARQMNAVREHHGGPNARRPARVKPAIGKLIPAMVVLATLPGCLEFLVALAEWRTGNHVAPLRDGANVWEAARLVLSGRLNVVFDPYYPQPFLQGIGFRGWAYPPSMLLIAVPFGLLSPLPAVLLYDAISLCILAACLRAARFGWAFSAAIILSPAALDDLADSQNGAFVAGLLIAGLWRAEAQPWLGGALLGLATVKPQLGLLIPVYLLARGNWRAIAGATITAAVLGAASSLAFGLTSWPFYFGRILPFMAHALVVLTAEPGLGPQAMMMSVFSLAREAGSSVTLAYAVQAASTLAVCAGAWWAGRRIADTELRLAILLVMISLAPPYLWCYDMIPGSAGVALLVNAGLKRGFYRGEFLLLALLWITPGLAIYLAAQRLPGFCPLIVIGVLIHAWRHAASGPPLPPPGKAR
jgi:hypothetical protein